MKRRNLAGQRYGRLAVIELAYVKNQTTHWLCKCDCGNESIISLGCFGKTQSCGCLRKEVGRSVGKITKHGETKTRLYGIWNGMKHRCLNSKAPNYKWYGDKGITIYDKWINSFESFREWSMSNGYRDDLVIDRINNDGDYCPENCQWITLVENSIKSNKERKQ